MNKRPSILEVDSQKAFERAAEIFKMDYETYINHAALLWTVDFLKAHLSIQESLRIERILRDEP